MFGSTSRRQFLSAAVAGSLVGLDDFSFLSRLKTVSASDSRLSTKSVTFHPEIEPIVRLLEDSPREKVLEAVAERLAKGLSYRELLSGLFLATIRNVQPRPAVGFKFHAVLVVHSAHLASLSAPDSDRWLPIFWAIDEFKSSQARDVQEGNWTMPAVDEAAIPAGHRVQEVFLQAMSNWDEAAADVAAAGLARHLTDHQSFNQFARVSVRDFRSIGHKAIYVANGFRTLQTIGWQHAEPVLRSLAYALLNHNGEENPATSDLAPDRAGRRNNELARKIRADWKDGKYDAGAMESMLSSLRDDNEDRTCELVVELFNRGVSAKAIYDALFLCSGELLMRQPGIVGLHAVTSTNAMHYLFQSVADDETRLYVLLQNAAFLPMFRREMQRRGNVGATRIDQFEPKSVGTDGVADVFQEIGNDRATAAAKLLALLNGGGSASEFANMARRVIFAKGTDSHDYKFSSAVLEDYHHISPAWQNRFLASSAFQLRSSTHKDNSLVPRIRAAIVKA